MFCHRFKAVGGKCIQINKMMSRKDAFTVIFYPITKLGDLEFHAFNNTWRIQIIQFSIFFSGDYQVYETEWQIAHQTSMLNSR